MRVSQMCDCISWWIKQVTGKDVSTEDIWNSSPTGELAFVYELYCDFHMWLTDTKMQVSDDGYISFVDTKSTEEEING